MSNTPRLCYVDRPWAYFTTQPITKQWGDDWDDAPYEHNAGTPYEPCWHNDPDRRNKQRAGVGPDELCRCTACVRDWNDDGTPKWEVTKVAFDAPAFATPEDFSLNSSFSVEQINAGAVAWLFSRSIAIHAGCTLRNFKRLITEGGGTVYLPSKRGAKVAREMMQ
jgi:hypothetical protein